jgi:NAD+ kinase
MKIKKKKTSLAQAKNVVIVYRPESPAALKFSIDVANWLLKKNLTVYSHPEQKIPEISKIKSSQMTKIDLVVVLGGDGTYLQAVHMLGAHDAPILGANMGSLGFLTDIRKEDIFLALDLTLKNQMELRPRSMIEVKLKRGEKIIHESRALNDVVIERGPFSHLINLSIYSQSHLVNEVKADGLVISTPTGSTAYNLAAGGPILHPEVHSVVVTPICPHSLTNRPIIFPDNQTLTFKLSNRKQRAFLAVDGRNAGDLKANDEVIITRAKGDRLMIKKPSVNYFDLLREKLKFGER